MEEEYVDPKNELIQVLFNKNGYKDNYKKILETISSGNEEILSLLIDSVFTVLNSQDEYSPETKLHSIRAIKDLMSIRRDDISNKVSEELIPTYLEIAQFQKEEANDDRGKTIFGNDPTYFVYGNSFLRCILESIYVWATWFPGTAFEETYLALLDLQVTFPKKMSYFKPEDLENNNVKTPKMNSQKLSHQNFEEIKENPKIKNSSLELPQKLLEEIQISCQNLENLQENLVILLGKKEEHEIKADIKEIMENFKKVRSQHHEICQKIADSNNEQLEQEFLGKLMEEIEVIETILGEYEKYTSGKMNFNTFRYEFTQYEETKEKEVDQDHETPDIPHIDDLKAHHHELEKIKEEEIHSRVDSNHSMSINKSNEPFEEKAFQKEVLSNIKNFNQNRKRYLHYAKSDSLENIMRIIECCNTVMIQSHGEPITKVLAIRFIKEAMDKKNPLFVQGVSNILLDTIASTASYNYQIKERNRGKDFFGKNTKQAPDNEKLGLTFFLLALESIIIWARWFPKDQKTQKPTKFQRKYEELLEKGVVFPETLTYFKDIIYESEAIENDFDNLKKTFAEELTPNEHECNQKAILDLIKEFSLRLNSEKIMELISKLGKVTKKSLPDKEEEKQEKIEEEKMINEHKLHIERLDQNLKFFKKILMDFEHYHNKSLTYSDFRQDFFEVFHETHLIDIKHLKGIYQIEPDPQHAEILIMEDDEEIVLHVEILRKYKQPLLLILEMFGNLIALKSLISTLKYVFSLNRNFEMKFKALLLLKHAMDIRNPEFTLWVEHEVLESLNFNIISMEEEKRDVMDKNEENFKRLHQECILIWSLWYPKINNKNSKFLMNFEEMYEQEEPLDKLIYFDKITYNEFEQNKLSEYCYFHQPVDHSLELFKLLKHDFLTLLEKYLAEKDFKEHMIENFLHVFEDLCRHQEHLHIVETEENVGFFQHSLKHFEIFQKNEHKDHKSQEIFIKNVIQYEKNQESLELSPGTSIQKSFLHDSNYFNETEENKIRPSVISMNYNSSLLKQKKKSFHEDYEEHEEEEVYQKPESHLQHEIHAGSHNFHDENEHHNENEMEIQHHNKEISHHNEYEDENNKEFEEEELHNEKKLDIHHHNEHEVQHHNENKFEIHQNDEYENDNKEFKNYEEYEHKNEEELSYHNSEENHEIANNHKNNKNNNYNSESNENHKEEVHYVTENKNKNVKADNYDYESNENLKDEQDELEVENPPYFEGGKAPNFNREKEIHKYNNNTSSQNLENNENEYLYKNKIVELEENLTVFKQEKMDLEKKLETFEEENHYLTSQNETLEHEIHAKNSEIFQLSQTLENKEYLILQLQSELEEYRKNGGIKEEFPRQSFQENEKSLQSPVESPVKLINTETAKAFMEESPEQVVNDKENLVQVSSSPNDFDEKDSLESPYLLNTEDLPLEKEIIFPFKSNLDYFSNKVSKQYKGKLVVEEPELFKEIEKNTLQDIRKFKLACLKPKQLIYKGNDVHVGTTVKLQSHQGKNYVRLGVFLTNYSGEKIKNLELDIINHENLAIWSKSLNYGQELATGGQRKLDIILEYIDIPYKILKLIFKTVTQSLKTNEVSIFMPSTINMFMNWENCGSEEFNNLWIKSLGKKNVKPYKSRAKQLDFKIARSLRDLKSFFPYMVEILDYGKEKNTIKKERSSLGGIFKLLNNKIRYLMKISLIQQEQNFVIRLIENSEEEGSAKGKEFLLRNLMFLLGNKQV